VWGGEGSQRARRGLENNMRQCLCDDGKEGAVGYSGEKECALQCAFIVTRRKRRLGGGENGENRRVKSGNDSTPPPEFR